MGFSASLVLLVALLSVTVSGSNYDCRGSWVDQGSCSSYCGPGKVLQMYVFDDPRDESHCESKGYRIGACENVPCPKPSCPGELVLHDCAPACPATCSDPTPKCSKKCLENVCACPEGTVYHEGHCITVELCPPVDCVMSEWQDVGKCSRTCGTGVVPQTRDILEQPMHGGERCGSMDRLVECNTEVCPIDCPGGMEFSDCGRDCTPTCEDPNPTCTQRCTGPRCQCPLGQVLDGSQCVYQSQCSIESTTIRRRDTTTTRTTRKTTTTTTSTTTSTRKTTVVTRPSSTTQSTTTPRTTVRRTTQESSASQRPTTFATRGTTTVSASESTEVTSRGCVLNEDGSVLLNICDCEEKFLNLNDATKDQFCESCWDGTASDICTQPITPFDCVYGSEHRYVVLLLDSSVNEDRFSALQGFALMDLGLQLPVSDTTPVFVGSFINDTTISSEPVTNQRSLSRAINKLESSISPSTRDLSTSLGGVRAFVNDIQESGRSDTKIVYVVDSSRTFDATQFDAAAASLEADTNSQIVVFKVENPDVNGEEDDALDASGDGPEVSSRTLPATNDGASRFINNEFCDGTIPTGTSAGPRSVIEGNDILCHDDVDLVVVLDNSRSITTAQCSATKNTLVESLRHLDLFNGDDRIGVVAVSSEGSRVVVPLSNSTDVANVEAAIETVPCSSRSSGSLRGALEEAAVMLEADGRGDAVKSAVVFTDGNSQDSISALASSGERLRDSADTTRVYFIGDNINSLALSKISPTFIRSSEEVSTGTDLVSDVIKSEVCDLAANRDMIPIVVVLALLFLFFLLGLCCLCCFPLCCAAGGSTEENEARAGAAGAAGGEDCTTVEQQSRVVETTKEITETKNGACYVAGGTRECAGENHGVLVDRRIPIVTYREPANFTSAAWGFQRDPIATRDITRESWEYENDEGDTISTLSITQRMQPAAGARKPACDTVSIRSVSTTVTRGSRARNHKIGQPAAFPTNRPSSHSRAHHQPRDISGWVQCVDDSISSQSGFVHAPRQEQSLRPPTYQHSHRSNDDPFERNNVQAAANPRYAGYRGDSSFA